MSNHNSLQQTLAFRVLPASIGCKQSLFFFRFSEGNARGRERRAAKPQERREKRGRQPEKKKERLSFCASPVSRLQPRAWSFACLARFARRTKEKRETAHSLRRAGSWRERQRDKKRAPSRFVFVSRSASVSCSHRLLTQLLYLAATWSHWDKHVLGWWKHRDDANVLFLKYEDLLKVCNYIERLLFSSFRLFLTNILHLFCID